MRSALGRSVLRTEIRLGSIGVNGDQSRVAVEPRIDSIFKDADVTAEMICHGDVDKACSSD